MFYACLRIITCSLCLLSLSACATQRSEEVAWGYMDYASVMCAGGGCEDSSGTPLIRRNRQ